MDVTGIIMEFTAWAKDSQVRLQSSNCIASFIDLSLFQFLRMLQVVVVVVVRDPKTQDPMSFLARLFMIESALLCNVSSISLVRLRIHACVVDAWC